MTRLRAADRRALTLALAEAGPADGGRPGEPGPARATWARLQAAGWLDPAHPLPAPTPPAITQAGLRALGLPDTVPDAVSALRAAVRHLLPWRRPAVRLRGLAVSIDDPDDETAPPIVVSAGPGVISGVHTANERAWEAAGGCADTVWDAVYAWTAHVGFPLDTVNRGDWRIVHLDAEGAPSPVAGASPKGVGSGG